MRMRSLTVMMTPLLLVGACGGDAAVPGRVAVGEPAPAYSAVSLEGKPVALDSLRGDVVLLNVWATWCHPCQKEIPALQKLHETYADRGLRVVGVSVDTQGEEMTVREFAQRYGMTYPVWLDPSERVSSTFRTIGVPSTFLIDPEGKILWKHVGPVEFDDPQLQKHLQESLERVASS